MQQRDFASVPVFRTHSRTPFGPFSTLDLHSFFTLFHLALHFIGCDAMLCVRMLVSFIPPYAYALVSFISLK